MIKDHLKNRTQLIELTNGCPNNCSYCKEETKLTTFAIPKIVKNYVQILDMNFLYNPNCINLIKELGLKRVNNKIVYYELVCGLDFRLMSLDIAKLLKKNRFIKPRIAWDLGLNYQYKIRNCLNQLKRGGFNPKEIMVFILSNWRVSYYDCLKKLDLLKIWGVKVGDCYFDNQLSPNIKPIYWLKSDIMDFRTKCRKHNQLIGFGYDPEYNTLDNKTLIEFR